MPAIEQALAAITVLGLLAATLWIARRKGALLLPTGQRRGQSACRVTQRVPLTAQHCLHLVEANGSVLLVGTHPGGIVFAPQSYSFARHLQQAGEREAGDQA